MENKGRYVDYFDEWQRRNKMNYPVLEIFDIVEFRDGRLAVVLPISEEHDEKMLGLFSRAYVFSPLIIEVCDYNDDLICKCTTHSSDLDIMKVLKYSKFEETPTFSYGAYMRLLTDIVIRRGLDWSRFKTFNIEDRICPFGWTWEREEVKEVTMDDIEKKFGCKVKIVKEEGDGKLLDDFVNHMFPPVEDKPGYIWINKRNHEMAKADLVKEKIASCYEQYCILREKLKYNNTQKDCVPLCKGLQADMVIMDEFLTEEENNGK